MNRKKNGGFHRSRIGTKARRLTQTRKSLSSKRFWFWFPVATWNAAEFPIYLILAYNEKEMGILFHDPIISAPFTVMDLSRIVEKFYVHGVLEYDIISRTLSCFRSHRSEGDIEANGKLRSRDVLIEW